MSSTRAPWAPVADYIEASTCEDFIEVIRSADAAGTPLLVLGGAVGG